MKRFSHFVLLLILCSNINVYAQSETFSIGSYIINMGSPIQTIENGLKPYGLVYELLKDYKVPVKWVIGAGKAKDKKDFTYSSVDYRGGTFIVPKEFISQEVYAAIREWETAGIVGLFTTSSLTVFVTQTLTSVPNWTLNTGNIAIAQKLFKNAGIPSSAYNSTIPSKLGACNDIFVLPHSSPTWALVGNLLSWNRDYKGAIWSGCHAASELENLVNPEDTLQRLNFLSTDGLMDFESHSQGSAPFNYFFNRSNYNGGPISARPDDPVFQMVGNEDAAHINGSEQVYVPTSGSAWRNTTHIGCYDSIQADVTANSPNGPAAVTLYGRGHGLSSSGLVMYQSGHNLDGAGTANVAAMRQFFNFSFEAMKDKVPVINAYDMPVNIESDIIYRVSVNAKSPVGAKLFYKWSSSCPGSFADPTLASTIFTPTDVDSNLRYTITCEVTDACSRYSFISGSVTGVVALPVTLFKFGSELVEEDVHLVWATASEEDIQYYTVFRSLNGTDFIPIGNHQPIKANSSMDYLYIDKNVTDLKAEKLYYKLQMVENHQTTVWSNICYINLTENNNLKMVSSLYPNPSSEKITILLRQVPDSDFSVSIIDNYGRLVRNVNSPELNFNKELVMDIGGLDNGIYFFQIKTSEGTVTSCRFIKTQN